jgi:hypothetical protein
MGTNGPDSHRYYDLPQEVELASHVVGAKEAP